jgi:hypothetical protein
MAIGLLWRVGINLMRTVPCKRASLQRWITAG